VTRIKICGVNRAEDAVPINEALPDFAGFVFVGSSRRAVEPAHAAALRQLIDPRVVLVGVFRDAPVEFVADLVAEGTVDFAQLHGAESAEYIRDLKARVNVPVIKAVSVTSLADVATPTAPDPEWPTDPNHPADCLLFDNGTGGTGATFDLALIGEARALGRLPSKPFFIAGGVGLDNLDDVLKLRPYGVDISSGAETDGVKDPAKIKALVAAVTSPRRPGR
jgi:phosphoribosylanthranilate isomerase